MDVGRTEVYAAERVAFDGTDLEEVVPFDTLTAAIADVVDGAWWPGPPVTVRAARSDARSSSARCACAEGAGVTISVARPQCTAATAAHELAHALAGVAAGHGQRFRRAHLDVVSVITNRSPITRRGDLHVAQLREAYNAAGLTIGSRSWPAPPDTDTSFAL